MSLRPTPNFTRWLTQPTRATTILRATQIQRPALRPFSLSSARSNTRTLSTKYTQPFQRPNPRSNQHQYQKRFNSTNNSNPNAQRPNQGHQQQQSSKEPSGLSARLKKLTREYGWAALGVYLTLSALDFPFCFAAVRLLGVERIGHFEHVILGYLKGVFGPIWPGIWTQLVFAYAIHKSLLIFVRVPLTAAVTPKVVKVLRRWGWDIGKRAPKST
ncbi:hypothetical protein N7509_005484 [Penicillium cosmopolitanum]|uniref:DUF1279 domain-containing protein n=1 Tax=Penicillium cosmopolitanum TaxID=1131564 RepID=A0A9W9W2I6_9EURO|nr:uncharacterized protein N7509_005484 [Penicillium cosmopolitanum]KAJ5397371.1 hypothetical protein N7509_005484 [Penicillium cosmopolitanum]